MTKKKMNLLQLNNCRVTHFKLVSVAFVIFCYSPQNCYSMTGDYGQAEQRASEHFSTQGTPWGAKQTEKLHTDYLHQFYDISQRFLGNQTHVDYFKLLQQDGNSLLIGARNVIYNISLSDLTENEHQRITWNPSATDRELCILKGKLEDDCQNYIRVLAHTSSDKLLVCGTNAFNPKCRYYNHNETHTSWEGEFSGRGFCPYDPTHNSTAIYTGGELYAGTVADFTATDSLIMKGKLRTEQYDYKHLNAPDFVSSLEDSEHVYFFLRESAVEYINCGKSIYSRVARVCKSDQGGPHKFQNKWTSFLKARLNCSVPGNFPFYFNEIQSTSQFVSGNKVYAVFNTPENSISGSAICSFNLDEFQKSFEVGAFKNQESIHSNWLPMSKSQIPSPRPGICQTTNSSLDQDETSLNFIKHHSLMDLAVSSSDNGPIFVQASFLERLTVIAVDPKVQTLDGQFLDVLFVGTSQGRVIKLVDRFQNRPDKSPSPILIESMQVFPPDVPVRNLLVTKGSDNKLVVISDHEVAALPLHRCDSRRVQACRECIGMQDPYCAWNTARQACVDQRGVLDLNHGLLQNNESGISEECAASEDLQMGNIVEIDISGSHMNDENSDSVAVNSCTNQCNCNCSSSPSDKTFNDNEAPNDIPDYDKVENSPQQASSSSSQPYSTDKEVDISIQEPFDSYQQYQLGQNKAQTRSSTSYESNKRPFFQSIDGASSNTEVIRTDISNDRLYTEHTLVLSVLITTLFAISIGFSVGFWLSKRWTKEVEKAKKIVYITNSPTLPHSHHLCLQSQPSTGSESSCILNSRQTPSPSSSSTAYSTSSSSNNHNSNYPNMRLVSPSSTPVQHNMTNIPETFISSTRSLNLLGKSPNQVKTFSPAKIQLSHAAMRAGNVRQAGIYHTLARDLDHMVSSPIHENLGHPVSNLNLTLFEKDLNKTLEDTLSSKSKYEDESDSNISAKQVYI